ncbi:MULTISPECIES: single-stranded DNA-binding protein [Clostridium]|uniref:single-stranded DNA-binding protein n=1 Tax=Clostridium TaxID=1485 RepID=UPI00016BD1D4|nr:MULTISPECIES: single-stranded DNA-binding protein [Clostridium]EDT26148.1 single-strand binding protein family [Clostridium perfringens CPE str. F4969]EGT0682003.1 single-stranded DNA-binding protein [Clostridium perfringens]MDH5064955.1 Single-stranded DNA-binding protein SsbB [Clostridium perfringens]MDK0853201.1 single-stranded DNA-binding protein [Clostridium perfringens]MDU2094825.1 single-stranded DNA-binding protein [Clostridium perfringens]
MNTVQLLGRMVKDPDINVTSNTTVAKFTLAVNRFKKGEADFISCVAFGKTAENIANFFFKGNQIAIKGRIQTGSYDAQDGTKRYTTDVVVEGFDFIDGNKKENNISSDENLNDALMEEMGGDNDDIPF